MFILGLLILAAAAVFSVELILANREQLTIHLWSWTWQADAFWLAVAGAILLFAAVLAFGLMRISATRMRRMRNEHRMLLAEHEQLVAARGRQPAAAQAPGKAYPAAPPATMAGSDAAHRRTAEPAYAGTGARADETAASEKHHRFFGRHNSD